GLPRSRLCSVAGETSLRDWKRLHGGQSVRATPDRNAQRTAETRHLRPMTDPLRHSRLQWRRHAGDFEGPIMEMPVKWVAELAHVREVSLLGTADLAYWKERLRAEGLCPAGRDGQAQILI